MLDEIPLVCPLDGLSLARESMTLRCENGHSFDIARQGYVNLLPVQHKTSLAPGDSKQMVDARRRVLDAGLFTGLANAIASILTREVVGALPSGRSLLVDAGCGEGFYTHRFADTLERSGRSVSVLGIDISKPAIIAAAARYRNLAWAVASNRRLPVPHNRADVITSLFGFETWEPWSKLQRAGQMVLVVDAGPQHLIELRRVIYPDVRVHDAPAHAAAVESGYKMQFDQKVTYTTYAENRQMIADILCMTPHGYKITPQGRKAADALDGLTLTLDATIRLFLRE